MPVNTDHRIRVRRICAPIPRLALVDDLAWGARQHDTLKHIAQDVWQAGDEAYIQGAILRLRFHREFLVVLVTWVFVHCAQRVQLGVLDCTEQRRGQPVIRLLNGSWHGLFDV